MRLSEIISSLKNIFEKKRKNVVQLETDSNLESNLKTLKVSDKSTPIQISEDTVDVKGSLKVNGIDVSTEPDDSGSGGASALNELSDVTYSSGDLTISSLDKIVAAGNLTLDVDTDLTLDANGGDLFIQDNGSTSAKINTSQGTLTIYGTIGSTDDFSALSTTTNGATSLTTTDAAGSDADLNIDVDGDLILDSHTGKFIAKKAGTQFSVANSAYAGMILGYRLIGEDVIHASYTLTSSFAVPNSAMTVRFVAPPSGCVEVMIQIYANASTSNRFLYFGLSDNATYNTIGVQYEHLHRMPDETDDEMVQHYWTITGLTAGDTYNYWLGARTNATSAFLNWGGNATGRYGDFIMKVTALPEATSDFAEYD